MISELDASPDWLTVTTQHVDDTEYLRSISDMYIHSRGASKPWRFRDYVGQRRHDGDGRGGVAFAEKDHGRLGICQAWGALSNIVGRALAKRRLKATRVDLQVTVLHNRSQPAVKDLLDSLPADVHKYTAIVPLNHEGGTLYVGSRSSDAFGRLYDKGAELGADIPPRVLWRYEVEYKRKLAVAMADQIWYSDRSLSQMRTYVLAHVEEFFQKHQVPTPFSVSNRHNHSLVRYATRVQDSAKTLKWLTEQVQPAVLRLVHEGHAEQITEVLGIGVLDGVPTFEAVEEIPAEQMLLWPPLDSGAEWC
ncbi:unnamed protein product [marine sediment metagenome]|uniref:Replication initiation protein-like C-terminal domain-containing protein n=1 Tax=marine sediment metagenome TaxID=412755 RepID=X1JGE6_9ZZZZ